MNLSDTDQAPYSAPSPQTATVSDEAVQAALDKCEKVDWVQGLFGTGLSGREIIESALTAAAPYLTASVEVGEFDTDAVKRLTQFSNSAGEGLCVLGEVLNVYTYPEKHPQWQRIVVRQLAADIAALLSALKPKPVDVAAVRRQAVEEAARVAEKDVPSDCAYGPGIGIAKNIRALSPAAPVGPWQDIVTAPKDGTEILCICMKASKGYKNYLGRIEVDHYRDDICGFGRFNNTLWPATHWMPLPAAPTSKGGE